MKAVTPVVQVVKPVEAKPVETNPVVVAQVRSSTVKSETFKENRSLINSQIISKLRRSWFVDLLPTSDSFFTALYSKLTSLDPEIGGLFIGVDMKAQNVRLSDSITSIMKLIYSTQELNDLLKPLGERHV